MTMTNQGDEAVRLARRGVDAHAAHRLVLFQLSSRSAGSSSGAVPCDRLAWLLDA